MSYIPVWTLRSADNSTEIFHFPVVQDTNLPKTPRDTVTKTNLRSKGAVVIDGGIKPYDAILEFILYDNSGEYTAIEALIDALETAIPVNTAFILRYPKTATTWEDIKVKRLEPFEYPNVAEDKRLYRQIVRAKFLANAW